MKRPLNIVLLLFLSGILLGIGGALMLNVYTSSNGSADSLDRRSSFENGAPQPNDLEQPTSLGSHGDISEHVEGLKEILAASQDQNSIELKATVLSFVAEAPQSSLGAILELLRDESFKHSMHTKHELQRALLAKLAKTHPREALGFAVEHDVPQQLASVTSVASMSLYLQFALPPSVPAQTSFITTVFNVWSARDQTEAIAQAIKLDDENKKLALDGILQSQVGKSLEELRKIAEDLGSEQQAVDSYLASFNTEHLEDPRDAWTQVCPLASTRNLPHEWVLKNVVLQWYEREGVSIVDDIQASEASSSVKSETTRVVLWHAVEDSPEEAFRLALEIPIDMRLGMPYVHDVVRAWANADPQAAYDALDEIEDPFLLDILPSAVVSTWAWNDPHYVLENIKDFPPRLHDTATASAIGSIAMNDPLEGAERALKISNPTARSRALDHVINIWRQLDVDAVVNWVENVETHPWQRFELVDTLTGWLVSDDPLRAFDIARKETGLSWDDTGLEADIVRSISRYEGLETAVELLPQVREGKTRAVASAHVADTMIRNGDTTRALALGLDLPPSEQEVYFPSIADTWVDVDPGSLLEALEKIPAQELRSKVALQLFKEQRVDNYTVAPVDSLTETQVELLKQHLTAADRATIDEQ